VDWRALLKALHAIGYDGAVNFELEHVPGSASWNSSSTGQVMEEHRLAVDYIRKASEGLGIEWETRY
jgi:sugar phosphate isomerase/epimerase